MKKIFVYSVITLIIITSIIIWYRAEKVITRTTSPSLDTIIVGTNAEFQPFSFKDEDAITGFDIDVITEALKRLGKEIIFKDMPFDALIPEIQLGNIHIIAAGITPTKERAQRALFTNPHLTGDPLGIISVKTNNPITTIENLIGKTVVVNEGYTADTYISKQPGISVIRLSSPAVSDGMLALNSSRADAYVTALNPMKPYFDKYGIENFVVTPIVGTEEGSAFAVSKYYPELRDTIQITLDRMQEDGTLAALKTKWNLS